MLRITKKAVLLHPLSEGERREERGERRRSSLKV